MSVEKGLASGVESLLKQPCKTVKLPENPAKLSVPPAEGNFSLGTGGKLTGMVTIRQIGTIGSQALRVEIPMSAVHRLNGSPLLKRAKHSEVV